MEGDSKVSPTKYAKKEVANSQDEADAWGRTPKPEPVPVAEMPVHKFSEFYNMKHKSRGQAIIFNHEHFDDSTLKSRSGTSLDCVNLAERLRKLGFRVRMYHDLKFTELKEKVNQAAADDHSECDCFFMAVLSHGERDILYTKDVGYKPDVLWTPFTADKCATLAGKPKLFFIQACQGDRFDSGVILRRTEVDGSSQYSIPSHADFLIAYSTIPGFFSWRNATKGSWFIQALCEELRERGAKLDILTLLTFVNQRVALNFESNVPADEAMNRKKQIPCITSMLTRRLIFTETEAV
ncbi:caspase-1-like [Ischnura elegans]|uniref:caspase-1-like n=1 Tax=Ischnura elegans TaxID=197161 RepID=UPI001ED88887|nr:caspase-1-like [Ischnura elegans]